MEKQESSDQFMQRVKDEMLNPEEGGMLLLQPGKQTIRIRTVKELKAAIMKHDNAQCLFLHYSGHGPQQRSGTISACGESQTSPDNPAPTFFYNGTKVKNILLLLSLFIFTSCTVTTITHSEAMDQTLGMTKEDVITGVGLPDVKQVEGKYEQWTYSRGQVMKTSVRPVRSTSTSTAAPGSINAYGNTGSVNVATSGISFGGGSTTQVYDKYVKLLFKDGVVVRWDTQGVDYSSTTTEVDPRKRTIGLIVSGIGVAIVGLFMVLS